VVRRGESTNLKISIGDADAAARADLAESLLLVDSFWESLLALVGKHFCYVFLIPFWRRGKAFSRLRNAIPL